MSVRNHNSSLSMRHKNMAITAQGTSSKGGVGSSVGKGKSCSTPEPHREVGSPCDSDSEASSPVPFLCTQDGSYGDTEVVWNYYTPNRNREPLSKTSSTTPLSRKAKIKHRSKIGQLQRPKQRVVQKKTPLFQDLLQELNKNIQGILEKTQRTAEAKEQSASEEDIFGSSPDRSPVVETLPRSSSRCLRRNLLSSKFSKPESDTALESDDSMNECLMRASQMIEEKVFCSKRNGDPSGNNCRIEQDSMDAIFNDIKMDSPLASAKKTAKGFVNDSFDNFVGDLNDSAIERLTQLPIIHESPRHNGASSKKNTSSCTNKNIQLETYDGPTFTSQGNSSGWTVKELIAMDSVLGARSPFSRHSSMPESPSALRPARPSAGRTALNRHSWTIKELIAMDSVPGARSPFSRHSSMPESPSALRPARPSAGRTALNRHSSMPYGRDARPTEGSSDDSTPIRCTPDEIKRKHQQAREKLLAKRLFPNASSQQTQPVSNDRELPASQPRRAPKFQPKVPTASVRHQTLHTNTDDVPSSRNAEKTDNAKEKKGLDLKSIIENKRKEAMMKLKMKRTHS